MFETFPVCVSCRHTPADADSGPQCTCGPPASLRLRLPGACRIQSASSSARLWLRHVKTPPPSLHMQAGATIHPSPTVLHQTIIVSFCPLQGAGDNTDKPFSFSFFYFPPLFKLL